MSKAKWHCLLDTIIVVTATWLFITQRRHNQVTTFTSLLTSHNTCSSFWRRWSRWAYTCVLICVVCVCVCMRVHVHTCMKWVVGAPSLVWFPVVSVVSFCKKHHSHFSILYTQTRDLRGIRCLTVCHIVGVFTPPSGVIVYSWLSMFDWVNMTSPNIPVCSVCILITIYF